MKYFFVLTLLLSGAAQAVTCSNSPDGAVSLGFNKLVFYDEPNLDEVSTTDEDSTSKWYPGIFSLHRQPESGLALVAEPVRLAIIDWTSRWGQF